MQARGADPDIIGEYMVSLLRRVARRDRRNTIGTDCTLAVLTAERKAITNFVDPDVDPWPPSVITWHMPALRVGQDGPEFSAGVTRHRGVTLSSDDGRIRNPRFTRFERGRPCVCESGQQFRHCHGNPSHPSFLRERAFQASPFRLGEYPDGPSRIPLTEINAKQRTKRDALWKWRRLRGSVKSI
jgi:hypothetical protein